MNSFLRIGFVLAGAGAGFLFAALTPSTSRSDTVTLQNGGVLRGKVAKSGKGVSVTTTNGARIVVDRSSVKGIRYESSAAARPSRQIKLTDAQNAWLPKVRKLVKQANGDDPDASGRALRNLRSINDPDAIPALSQYLRMSDSDSARLLYVRILGGMPGSQSVVCLIEEALFDSASGVREAAQEATKKQPAGSVRPYYGQALRFPNRDVVCRAATVLATVGDKENVPALIDSLYSATVDIEYHRSCCMSRVAYLAPGGGALYGRGYGSLEPLEAVPVVRPAQNPQVREALEAITKKSFGYNTGAWRRWWQSEQLADAEAASRRTRSER